MPNSTSTEPRILLRLENLEAEKDVRQSISTYMRLCDPLGVDSDLKELTGLFSEDAIWQGKGKRYARTFGRYEGRDAIGEMFSTYTKSPAHFELNAHFLCNEVINVDIANELAKGSWMLIQPSSFSSGKSQLSCAYINAEFILQKNTWLISSFTTENIFSRPMADPWNNSAALAVPDKKS